MCAESRYKNCHYKFNLEEKNISLEIKHDAFIKTREIIPVVYNSNSFQLFITRT